jgi:hypothetical protein
MFVFKNKIALVAVWLIAIVYCFIESTGKGDFYIFLSAASDLSAHQNIFENKYVDGYHYYYSVLFALLLKPLCYLPFRLVKFCWLLLNLFLYGRLFQMLAASQLVKRLSEKQRIIFLGGVFLFSLRFLLGNIDHSQITILILWCCVYGMYNISHNKPVSGSLALAIGINIKLLPIVFLPYLLYRGYFKAVALIIIFYAAGLALPSLLIGHAYNVMLLTTWLGLINPASQIHVLDVDERSFHGLSTLLSTLLVKDVPDVYALPLRRNIADISVDALAKILLGVRLFLAGFTLFFLKGKPFQKAASETGLLTELSYLLLLIPLIFPHQQHYAFLFSVPAFALVYYDLIINFKSMSNATRNVILLLLIFIYLSANLTVIFGAYNAYYEHFKIMTYGALLLIPLLIRLSLKKEKTLAMASPAV